MVDSYEFGEIIVDGKTYTSDVILFPDRVVSDWWRREGHKLSAEDVKDIVAAKPEVVIVGAGYSGFLQVPVKTKHLLESEGIELLVLNTTKACRKYNELCKTKRVVAALHLTC
ncbi:MAG: hypothetical protein JSW03_09680 [Candidatus Eiseniibacteriota bacterium]|nr:MAG: hypothetical protein JSW03_09680 [Candidatus Eisenbacteria bacterium]